MDHIALDHYDPASPDFIAALEAAQASPELRELFLQKIRGEETRMTLSQGEQVRGVCISAMNPTLHSLLPPSAVLKAAQRELATRAAFRETDDYQFLRALIAAETLVNQSQTLLEMARAAYDRGFPHEAEKASHHASDAAAKLSDASMQASAAFTVAERVRSKTYEQSLR